MDSVREYNPRMSTLRAQLNSLAASFAEQVIAAIRSGSLNDLVGSGGADHAGHGRVPRVARGGGGMPDPLVVPAKKRGKSGRLPRRSPEEITAVLNKIVLLVKTQKSGMRAEEIRSKLGMEPKEMPRILKEGVSTKKLTTKGQKRATTYFAK
jgi:hypothetical protein